MLSVIESDHALSSPTVNFERNKQKITNRKSVWGLHFFPSLSNACNIIHYRVGRFHTSSLIIVKSVIQTFEFQRNKHLNVVLSLYMLVDNFLKVCIYYFTLLEKDDEKKTLSWNFIPFRHYIKMWYLWS